MRFAKKLIYDIVRALHLHDVASALGTQGYRILCYHGLCADNSDLTVFRPKVFMTSSAFQGRITWLLKNGFTFLSLDRALMRAHDRSLPKRSVVITFDEGFSSFHDIALPILRSMGIPSTVYVTTYHVEKRTPVFRLAMQYIIWKYGSQNDAVRSCHPDFDDFVAKHPDLPEGWQIVRYCETQLSEAQRYDLLLALLRMHDEPSDATPTFDSFRLMSHQMLTDCERNGVLVGLHTHRHRPTVDFDKLSVEIADNCRSLESGGVIPAQHLAYPSGIWSTELLPKLATTSLASAATCVPGLNGAATNPYALRRFVDSSFVRPWEFEAEMLGISDLARRVAGRHNDEPGCVASDRDIPRDLQT